MNLKCKKKLGIISLAFFISLLFFGCKDNSIFEQTYNKEILKTKKSCLALQLTPYSKEVATFSSKLYAFNENCEYIVNLSYKTDIGCNSLHNTNKSYSSYIDITLYKKETRVYTLYKDLKKDDDFQSNLQKMFETFLENINL